MSIHRAPDGMLLGVCKGIAQSRNLPVPAVRLAVVALTMMTAALMEASAPQGGVSEEERFRPDPRAERARLMRDLKERILRMDKRIQRMEDQVVRPDFHWDKRWDKRT